jgi:hypothetical protein
MNAISLARVSVYSFNDEIAASLGRVACLDQYTNTGMV